MPNWCDNTIEILARKEINDEIKQNIDSYLGRRFDDAKVSETTVPYEKGQEIWSWICISVRTGYGPPGDFINHVVKDYKNVLLKGHYWIEGGCGAADFEMSSDDMGNVEYHSHDEINQDYMSEEELDELQEQVTLEEIEFDTFGTYNHKNYDGDMAQSMIDVDHFFAEYELAVPREEELNYNVYELLEKEKHFKKNTN